MPASKARMRANAKYTAKAYDRLTLLVPKGQKAVLQANASTLGESLNGFVTKAINERLARLKEDGILP